MSFLNPFGRRKQQQEELTRLVLDYILAPDEQVEAFLEAHADALLSDAAEKVFTRLLNEARGDEDTSLLIRDRHNRLMRILVDKTPKTEAPDIPLELLIQAFSAESDAEFDRVFSRHPELMSVYMQVVKAIAQPAGFQKLLEGFIASDTWPKRKAYVQAHPEMLSYERVFWLVNLLRAAKQNRNQETQQIYREYLDLLDRCRRLGINAAFAGYLQEDELQDKLDHLNRLIQEHPDDKPRRLAMTREILSLVDKRTHPKLWADLRGDLGVLLLGRIAPDTAKGPLATDHANDVEEIIACFQDCASVYTRQVDPEKWASIQSDLGSAYLHRIHSDPADNVEQGIKYYKLALQVYDQRAFPHEWARTHYNLGRAYWSRIWGDWADNLEQAIAHNLSALEVWTRKAAPEDWASIQVNLGLFYANRMHGDQAENTEQSIAYCQRVLEVFTREAFPESWANIQDNLARIYIDRPLGDRDENIEQAIRLFRQALAVITKQNAPERWANLQAGLGGAYHKRVFKGDRADNVEQAIAYYQRALEIRTRQTFPARWASLQHDLGLAYRERLRGERSDNLEQAIHHFQLALQVYTRQAFPDDWAMTRYELARIYAERLRGQRADNVTRARDAYGDALQVHTLEAWPDAHRKVQTGLGDVYFTEHRWAEASAAYTAARVALERLYQAGTTPQARQAELRRASDDLVNPPYCLARLGRFQEAVETVEHGKARALREMLAHKEAVPEAVSAQDRAALDKARARVSAFEAEARAFNLPNARSYLEISADLRQARADLDTIVTSIRRYVPGFMAEKMDFARIASVAQARQTPLVYLLTTSAGSLALVVPPGLKVQADQCTIWLDGFNTGALEDLMYDPESGESRYLSSIAGVGSIDNLVRLLDAIWPALQTRVMAPIAEHLVRSGYQQATLIPVGLLGILPLPAIVFDKVTLTYAPSARALQAALTAARRQTGQSPVLLGVGNPLPNPRPLPFARMEVEEVARLFSVASRRTLYERQATRAAILKALPGATHVHFSCHGTFDASEPLDSALFLSGDDTLTLRDLLDGGLNLSAARLAVLSACETGQVEYFDVPDEAVGFPAGFLQAGVPGVVSALWPVADISTAFLLTHFYRHHLQDGLEPATALHKAQAWLRTATVQDMGLADYYQRVYQESGQRDVDAFRAMRYCWANPQAKPFAHPYYWAAFVFSGVGV